MQVRLPKFISNRIIWLWEFLLDCLNKDMCACIQIWCIRLPSFCCVPKSSSRLRQLEYWPTILKPSNGLNMHKYPHIIKNSINKSTSFAEFTKPSTSLRILSIRSNTYRIQLRRTLCNNRNNIKPIINIIRLIHQPYLHSLHRAANQTHYLT